MAGKESYPKINFEFSVGSVCKTNQDGDVVITQSRKGGLLSVKFVETGNEYEVRRQSLAHGVVRDNQRDRTPDFIARARKKHGDKYDYSKTKYTGAGNKIIVTCPVHGDIETRADVHLNGHGCRECGKAATREFHTHTTEDFIAKAVAKFGDNHDYSRVKYVNAKTPVEIGCKIHGWFLTTPDYYMTWKTGCAMCAEEQRAKEYAISFDDFVERSRAVHGDKYSYHKEDYKYIKEKTRVTCPEHGDWWIVGIHHTRGVGCGKCAGIALKDTEQFIREAKEVHGDKYDYSKSVYTLNKDKIEIVCPEHGSFWQTPGSHLMGSGCSACANCGFDQTKMGSLYILNSLNMVKVGITNRDVSKRLKEINTSSPEVFSFVKEYSMDGILCREAETKLLRWLSSNYKGALSNFQGSSECFLDVPLATLLNKVEEVLNV